MIGRGIQNSNSVNTGNLMKKQTLTITKLLLLTAFLWASRPQGHADVIVVPTISALRAVDVASLTNDTVALVIDYYTESEQVGNDGVLNRGRGGGHFRFRWNTNYLGISGSPQPSEDYGRWIAPNTTTNGYWERMLQGEAPNVKMWGAMGNGIANQYEADRIQRAINACNAAWGGWWANELVFPAGVYVVTNTLVFPASLHLRGEGRQWTRLVMPVGIEKDILRTANAHSALTGGAFDFDHNLNLEKLSVVFDGTQATRNTVNSCLVVCKPGEGNIVRDFDTKHGAIGIRCLGGGTPGLRLENVGVGYQAVAGISIEPVPGSDYTYGLAEFRNISGDYFYQDDFRSNTCLIRFTNALCNASISGLKAEGRFGGGVVQYQRPNAVSGWGIGAFGAVSIHNATLSGDYGLGVDFLVLKGDQRTPSVTIDQVHLYGCRYLIRDEVSGRMVEADYNTYGAYAQDTARLPIHYESFTDGSTSTFDDGSPEMANKGTRLIVGQTAYSYLYATNAGWYRVMQPISLGPRHLAGKLVITAPGRESTELQIDVTPGFGSGPWINVTRSTYGAGNPVVTKARAFYFPASIFSGYWAFVDVYVGNPISSGYYVERERRITFAHDINGYEGFDSGQIQLLNPLLVSTNLPSGAVSTTVNTFR